MKVDPNQPIDYGQEYILCENGEIVLHTGERISGERIEDANSGFQEYCRSLDPNKCFLIALVLNDADRPLYFRARDVARQFGLHVQAPIDTPERYRQVWDDFLTVKQHDRPVLESVEGSDDDDFMDLERNGN